MLFVISGVLAVVGGLIWGQVAVAPAAAATVTFDYRPAQTVEDTAVLDMLKARGWLEPIRAKLESFRLKRAMTVRLQSCSGWGGAWYEGNAVTVCYRYIGNVMRHAAREDRPAWVSQEEAIAGGVVDVFLHEFAHGLFDQHQIPILGREEDAADQLSAYMMLTRSPDEAKALVTGTAHLYWRWLRDFGDGARHGNKTLGTGARAYTAEPHGSSAQRFYNLVCLAYGSDEKLFKELAKSAELPEDRAEGCEDEYALVANAWKRLIAPHVDDRLMLRARAKNMVAPFRKVGG